MEKLKLNVKPMDKWQQSIDQSLEFSDVFEYTVI